MTMQLRWPLTAGLLVSATFVAACCCRQDRPNLNPCTVAAISYDPPPAHTPEEQDQLFREYQDASKDFQMLGVETSPGRTPVVPAPASGLRKIKQPQTEREAIVGTAARSGTPPRTRSAAEADAALARLRRGMRIADSLHSVDTDVRNFGKANNWCTVMAPEYQDAQRFIDRQQDYPNALYYGPVAQAVASPELANYTANADFDNRYILVAIVKVAAGKLGPSYGPLKLQVGLNCAFITREAGIWKAAMQPASGTTCPAATSDPSRILPVVAEDSVGDPSLIPPVVRFVQDTVVGTYLGVRCGRMWCDIGAQAATGVPVPQFRYDFSAPATVQARIKGWFDEQQLGVPFDTPALLKVRPAQWASVIPEANLGDTHLNVFEGGFAPVARVYIREGLSEYARKFGMTPGWNYITLTGKASSIFWSAAVINSLGQTTPLNAFRHPHTIGSIPGTARWAWLDHDEWIWVSCDVGCCLIQAGDS
jgi:hypothetical protein